MNYKKFQNIFTGNNNMASKIIFIIAVIIVLLLFEKSYNKESNFFADISKNEASLFFDFDNMKRAFAGEVMDNMTILDALNAAVAAGKIKLIYKVDEKNNTEIIELDGHSLDLDINKKQINFYLNSQKINQNEINKINIRPGDKIIVKTE